MLHSKHVPSLLIRAKLGIQSETVRDSLKRGVCSCTLICGLEFRGIAEADTRQVFMDILDKDVNEPLAALKVR